MRPMKLLVSYHIFEPSIVTKRFKSPLCLAPSHATTVPHLELYAAVLAVEIAELITEEMHREL